MLIFFADGRLGNQIFQYAFLKTIAKKNETLIICNFDSIIDVFDLSRRKTLTIKTVSVGLKIILKTRFFIEIHNILMMFYTLSFLHRLVGYDVKVLDEEKATLSRCFIIARSK